MGCIKKLDLPFKGDQDEHVITNHTQLDKFVESQAQCKEVHFFNYFAFLLRLHYFASPLHSQEDCAETSCFVFPWQSPAQTLCVCADAGTFSHILPMQKYK